MKSVFTFSVFVLLSVGVVFGQTADAEAAVVKISTDISKITKSLDELNKKLGSFAETFSSNQGLRLSEKQQRLLFAFEMLNRGESRLSTLETLKVQLGERELSNKRRMVAIEEELRSENIERTLAGALNAEEVRVKRRRDLQTQQTDLLDLLNGIENSIRETEYEITQTKQFLRRLRQQIFPAVIDELNDF
ncbi:MAG: hypothetical protein IPN69_13445 [Acidobacteria bacterium]|nr:hypothetical protein [Acidobacteriota bacterium]MBK8811721.1 hypothetical protein [Acidobacteriota bacterium]